MITAYYNPEKKTLRVETKGQVVCNRRDVNPPEISKDRWGYKLSCAKILPNNEVQPDAVCVWADFIELVTEVDG